MIPCPRTFIVSSLLASLLCQSLSLLPALAVVSDQEFDQQMAEAGREFRQGNYSDCERLLTELVRESENLGNKDLRRAEALNNLGEVLVLTGRPGEAEPLYKEAVEIRIRALGLVSDDVARSLVGLARVYRAQGRRPEALQLLRRALKIAVHADVAVIRGDDIVNLETLVNNILRNPDMVPGTMVLALVFDELASLYMDLGQYDVAERLLKKVVSISAVPGYLDASRLYRTPWEGGLDPGSSLINLAKIYMTAGRSSEREALFKQALQMRRSLYGPNNFRTRQARKLLSDFYRKENRSAEAEAVELGEP